MGGAQAPGLGRAGGTVAAGATGAGPGGDAGGIGTAKAAVWVGVWVFGDVPGSADVTVPGPGAATAATAAG